MKMANQISKRINAPPICEFRFFSQLVVEQLRAINQDSELSKGMQLPDELELSREPNIHQEILCKTNFYLKDERTFFLLCGGNLERAHRLNLKEYFNYDWWKKQTIVAKEKFHGLNTNIIEWFHTYLTKPLPSAHQFFKQEIRLAKIM
jgi:hypothetical protein